MMRLGFYLMIFLVIGAAAVHGQEPDSTRYINGLPVSEDDTVQRFPQQDLEPKNVVTPVPSNALPGKVLRALDKERQYQGWRDTIVYHENNTGLYLVPVKTAEGVRIFGLNEDGNAVTFDEVSAAPD